MAKHALAEMDLLFYRSFTKDEQVSLTSDKELEHRDGHDMFVI